MKILVTFIGFGAAFIVGFVLVISGAVGTELAECPALVAQFPATAMRCNLFSGFVLGGGLMAMVGAAVSSWLIAFGKWPD